MTDKNVTYVYQKDSKIKNPLKKKIDKSVKDRQTKSELITHTSEVFVQQFDVSVDDLKGRQLVVILVDSSAEVEAGVPEYKLKLLDFEKLFTFPNLLKPHNDNEIKSGASSFEIFFILFLNFGLLFMPSSRNISDKGRLLT
jgi:hypothetical protein